MNPAPTASHLSQAISDLVEHGPPGVDRLFFMPMRLLVEVLAADRAETCTVGSAHDLIRKLEGDRVTRPDRELEAVVDDVRAAELLVGAVVRRVVLAPVDGDVDDGIVEAAHARSVQACREAKPEHVAAGRTVDRELG